MDAYEEAVAPLKRQLFGELAASVGALQEAEGSAGPAKVLEIGIGSGGAGLAARGGQLRWMARPKGLCSSGGQPVIVGAEQACGQSCRRSCSVSCSWN